MREHDLLSPLDVRGRAQGEESPDLARFSRPDFQVDSYRALDAAASKDAQRARPTTCAAVHFVYDRKRRLRRRFDAVRYVRRWPFVDHGCFTP
jgi:hypothetical protein